MISPRNICLLAVFLMMILGGAVLVVGLRSEPAYCATPVSAPAASPVESVPSRAWPFLNWLLANRDDRTGLPRSHVGDQRFKKWAMTYDSAVVSLAYIAGGRTADAKKILDFYINTPQVWRLGGIIEAVNPAKRKLGEDWSVRSGSNIWIGIAAVHLYRVTGETQYLALAEKIAGFVLALQNKVADELNFGGIRLGPLGDKQYPTDQHLGYDRRRPAFFTIFSSEHNIDAYALFDQLYQVTHKEEYLSARDNILGWLKRVAYNKEAHRFNRGASRKVDATVATDVFSWGISALGSATLSTFEPGFAERLLSFVETNCLAEDEFVKPDGSKVRARGVDFVDRHTPASLGRTPLVSPEWTFQFINAYRRMEQEARRQNDTKRADEYKKKQDPLLESMLTMAVEDNGMKTFPYATQAEVLIGHEYRTPRAGNYSAIGVAYAVMVLSQFDPLFIDENLDKNE